MLQGLKPGRRIITLLTDFGLEDPYVAMMKGVMLGLNPEAVIVDITHEIQPQNILQAAFLLFHTYSYFPRGTIHVAVVDPGVGTGSRAIAMASPRAVFVAPDNGLLSYITGSGAKGKPELQKLSPSFRAFSLTRKEFWRKEVSRTFHGRDILAPVAAHLSLGVKLDEIGERVESILSLSVPRPEYAGENMLQGQVMHIDSFGNLITNIPARLFYDKNRSSIQGIERGAAPLKTSFPSPLYKGRGIKGERLPSNSDIKVEISGREIQGLSTSYEAGKDLLAIVGSLGCLEIASGMGNAAGLLKAEIGDRVRVYKSA